MKKMHGVITAMTTPFDAEGNVDVEGLKAQVNFAIEHGVDCLYPTGTTGEMYLMSVEERKLVARTVVEAAAGRVTVFIHVGSMKEEETVELAIHAKEIGADGIGVVTPSFFNVFERGMVGYYKRVGEAVGEDFPIYVYNIPQLAHNDITPEMLNAICEEVPNVVGIKYSFPDFHRLMDYRECAGGRLSVLFGADDMFLPALAVGCDGTVSGCSGPFPELFIAIRDKFNEGDMKGAYEAQKRANKAVRIMKGGADMSIFKTILAWRGVAAGYCRKPLTNLTEDEKAALRTQIEEFL